MSQKQPQPPLRREDLLVDPQVPAAQQQLDGLTEQLEAVERVLVYSRAESATLDETITVKKRQLSKAAQDHAEKLKRFELDEAKFEPRILELKESMNQMMAEINKVKGELRDGHKALRALKAEEVDAKEQIKDRRAYLNQQEDLIQEVLGSGNEQLADMLGKVDAAQVEKEGILAQILSLREQKAVAETEAEIAVARVEPLELKYKEMADTYRQALDESRAQLQEVSAKLKKVSLEVEAKVVGMETRENDVAVRETANAEHEKDLRDRELRYKSNQSIYNV